MQLDSFQCVCIYMWAKLKGVLFRRHPGGDNRHGVEHGGGELGLDRGLLHLGRRPLLGGLHGRRAARLHLRRLGNPAPAPGSSQSCHLDISGANSHNLSKVKQLEGKFFLRDYVDWLSDIQSPGSDLVLRTFIVMCNMVTWAPASICPNFFQLISLQLSFVILWVPYCFVPMACPCPP